MMEELTQLRESESLHAVSQIEEEKKGMLYDV